MCVVSSVPYYQVLVTSNSVTAASTSMALKFTTWTTDGLTKTVLVGAYSLNGQMSLPVVPTTQVVNFGWSDWEGLTSTSSFVDMSTTFGAWSAVATASNMKLVNKAFNGNYIACACYPYGHTYGLAMYTTNVNNNQQGVQRTYTQLVVGGSYSVSFWYAKTNEDVYAPTNFQVTLGGTPVWSTAPTSKSWVRQDT